jgi:hypothetical protein
LVTGIYTTNVPTVFADSRIMKLETKQNANCATRGGGDSLSDSCNQRAANNVINGVPRTAVNQKLRELYWLKRSVTSSSSSSSSSSTSANDSLIVDAKTFLPTVWILDLGISCLSFLSPNTTILSKISLTMSPIFRV